MVVPGREIGVANGPIDRNSVAQVRFEIEIAPAVTLASPHDRASTDLAPANPTEGFTGICGVWVLVIVDEEFGRPLIACVALALNGLILRQAATIAEAAEFHLPCGDVLNIVLLGNGGASGFEDKRFQTFLRKLFGGPAACDAGAHDDRIVSSLFAHFGSTGSFAEDMGSHSEWRSGMISKCNSSVAPASEV